MLLVLLGCVPVFSVACIILFYMTDGWWWAAGVSACSVIWLVSDSLTHASPLYDAVDMFAAGYWAYVAWDAWKRWQNGKRRKNQAEVLGHKARAVIEKMMDNMPAPKNLAPVPVK